jgi:hypothetical protein
MITLPLGELLNDSTIDSGEACVYVVRDGKTVFYVGLSTRNVINRILDHCGLSAQAGLPDSLGRLIFDNAPDSGAWQVELLTLADCSRLLGDPARLDEQTAEVGLIRLYSPCLNTLSNSNQAALLARYKHDDPEVRKAAGMLHIPYRRRGIK